MTPATPAALACACPRRLISTADGADAAECCDFAPTTDAALSVIGIDDPELEDAAACAPDDVIALAAVTATVALAGCGQDVSARFKARSEGK
jgi:hypothetical protein